ncbi:MAG: AMP-binding protein, partial [Rubrivivax sp.]|nr:AMP-binding protein [Rubrivivax sp.]
METGWIRVRSRVVAPPGAPTGRNGTEPTESTRGVLPGRRQVSALPARLRHCRRRCWRSLPHYLTPHVGLYGRGCCGLPCPGRPYRTLRVCADPPGCRITARLAVNESSLLSDLVRVAAERAADSTALTHGDQHWSYGELQRLVERVCHGLLAAGLQRSERVAVYLDKRVEMVATCFGSAAAGTVFVPLNPLLKPDQVGYILRDCGVRLLVTSADRLALLQATLAQCPELRHVIVTGDGPAAAPPGATLTRWSAFLAAAARAAHRVIDTDMLSILYTSGSTGRPKGVVLSHRNMVAGAKSVASYLANHPGDTLLAALPLSFDAGFSQLTTAFHSGARVVLLNYLLPRDVLRALERERVSGLTAVPPLYIQLSQLDWPAPVNDHLRYFANTGGRMPRE